MIFCTINFIIFLLRFAIGSFSREQLLMPKLRQACFLIIRHSKKYTMVVTVYSIVSDGVLQCECTTHSKLPNGKLRKLTIKYFLALQHQQYTKVLTHFKNNRTTIDLVKSDSASQYSHQGYYCKRFFLFKQVYNENF